MPALFPQPPSPGSGEGGSDTDELVSFERVNVSRGSRLVLRDLSLTIRAGEHVAILGPNGCGKSTLVKLIDRELYPLSDGGVIKIRGKSRWNVQDLRSTLGIVSNDLQMSLEPTRTATEIVLTGLYGKLDAHWLDLTPSLSTQAYKALKRVEAEHLADREFGTLSSGEARRVLIARALLHDPSALLLDEPTTSLDLVSAHHLLQTLRQLAREGKTLVMVTHHFEEIVPEIRRVIAIKDGRVFADGPTESVLQDDVLSELFEARIRLHNDHGYQAEVLD